MGYLGKKKGKVENSKDIKPGCQRLEEQEGNKKE